MKLHSTLIVAILSSVLLFSSTINAREFTFQDAMVASGKGRSAKGVNRRSRRASFGGDLSKKQFLIIAQAKLSGSRKHPSSPQVTVDVEPIVEGCAPFDWLFLPNCEAVKPRSNVRLSTINTIEYPLAYLHIFDLPSGWKNPRVGLPRFGKCASSRTANMRVARPNDSLCRSAQFRITYKTTKQECKRESYRSCSFWRCKTKYRNVCKPVTVTSYDECDRSYLVLRVFTRVERIPQVLSTSGGTYSSFRSCSDAAAANYFTT